MIAVVGDLMLDVYVYGRVERVNPDYPSLILWSDSLNEIKYFVGGCGNVFESILKLTDNVFLISAIGDDIFGNKLQSMLPEKYFLVKKNPTIAKIRFVEKNTGAILLRWDIEDPRPIDKDQERSIIDKLYELSPKVIVFSDYCKGVVTEKIVEAAKSIGITIADAKPKHKDFYRGINILKVNRKELLEYYGRTTSVDDTSSLENVAAEVREMYNLEGLIVTLGKEGCILCTENKVERIKPIIVSSKKHAIGAGDVFIAVLSFCISMGINLKDSTCIAVNAASIAVEYGDETKKVNEKVKDYVYKEVDRLR